MRTPDPRQAVPLPGGPSISPQVVRLRGRGDGRRPRGTAQRGAPDRRTAPGGSSSLRCSIWNAQRPTPVITTPTAMAARRSTVWASPPRALVVPDDVTRTYAVSATRRAVTSSGGRRTRSAWSAPSRSPSKEGVALEVNGLPDRLDSAVSTSATPCGPACRSSARPTLTQCGDWTTWSFRRPRRAAAGRGRRRPQRPRPGKGSRQAVTISRSGG